MRFYITLFLALPAASFALSPTNAVENQKRIAEQLKQKYPLAKPPVVTPKAKMNLTGTRGATVIERSAEAARPCSIPLRNVLRRDATPSKTPVLKPGPTDSFRMPNVPLPAPPCEEEE